MSCEACLTLPTVEPTEYTTKGSYEKMAGLDVYITGSATSTIGIIDVYDAFGMATQTLQGADMLATALNALVLVPDFFKGEPAKHEWVPPDTDEKRQLFTKFMTERAAFPGNVDALLQTVKEATEKYPLITAWGTFGLCWGGKVSMPAVSCGIEFVIVALASGPGTPFAATGQTHPGRLSKEDAVNISVPHLVLASKDEPADVVADYKEVIESNGKGGFVETYSTMHHGWMGARADLEDEANLKEYIRGYAQFAEFFKKYLK
ncbi:dienelactone hydrolase [Lipomyces doorenjongii]